jgi:CBS domain-containing protein
MARYGRDFDQERWGGYGQGRGGYRGEYGGMGADGLGGEPGGYGGMNRGGGYGREFGTGGGAYDRDFESGRNAGARGRGAGYGGDFGDEGGGMERGGFGGGYGPGYGGMGRSGQDGGYRGGGYGGGGYGGGGYGGGGAGSGYGSATDTDWNRGGMSGWGGGAQSERTGGRNDSLRRMRASEIMTDRPETVTPDATLADAAKKMRDLDVGIIPVVESSDSLRLSGVITDRDIAVRAVAEGGDVRSMKVSECMTTEVETCNKNDTLLEVLRVMEREQVRRVPITDREGRLVGIIAQADVITDVDDHATEHRVSRTVERISEPARPRRGGSGGGRASQSRGAPAGVEMNAAGQDVAREGRKGTTGGDES